MIYCLPWAIKLLSTLNGGTHRVCMLASSAVTSDEANLPSIAMLLPSACREFRQRPRGESPGEFPGGKLPAQAGRLPRPQRYEVSRSIRLGPGPERRDRTAGE